MAFLNKTCLRASSGVITVLSICMAIVFLVVSFDISENHVLKLMSESETQIANNHYEKKI